MAALKITKLIGSCLVACAATAGIAAVQLNGAEGFTWAQAWENPMLWLNTAPNPWLLLTTLISAGTGILGAWAAIAQLLAPEPQSQDDANKKHANVQRSFGTLDERTQTGFATTQDLIRRDKHEQALADLQRPDADPELVEQYDRVIRIAKERNAPITAEQAAQIAATALRTSQSNRPGDDDIARLIAQGDYLSAARRKAQLAQSRIEETHREQAAEFREAGTLALPFAPRDAKDYFEQATTLDPSDVWAWIELGRLRRNYDGLAAARLCYQNALQRVTTDRNRGVLHHEFGDCLVAEGQLAEARHEYESYLAIAETLAAADPSSAAAQRDLAISHERIGDVQVAQGDLTAARKSYDLRLAIIEKLAAADPSSAALQRDLSVSFNKIGDVSQAQGDLTAALTSYRRGLTIAESLAAADPSSAAAQRDLSVSFNKIGDVSQAQGDLTAALASYRRSLTIAESLAAADPSSAAAQRDLSVSFNKIGDVSQAQGDLTAALTSYRRGLTIRETLAAADPSSAEAQRDLAISHERIGDVQVAQGDLSAARKSYDLRLAIIETLAAADPSSAAAQRDLSVSYDKIGDVSQAQGDLTAALASYRRGLTIRETLAAADPSSAALQRDLAISHERIGDVQIAQGDLSAARKSYDLRLAIFEKLAAADPSSAAHQRDLWVSYWRLAQLGDADYPWSRVVAKLEEMAAKGTLFPADEQFLTEARRQAAAQAGGE